MNEDGTNAHRVTNTNPPPPGTRSFRAYSTQPAFSPDGSKIAFSGSSPDLTNFDIYVINSDGTNRVRLTNTPDNEFHPSWSSDGTRLAFARDALATGTGSGFEKKRSDIYVMKADGSDTTKVVDVADDLNPSWSPDGTRIAFYSVAKDGSSNLIYTVRPDGTQLTALTTTGYSLYPSWNADGQKLVFSILGSDYQQIAEIDANNAGGIPVRLIPISLKSALYPVFNSNGREVIFAASPDKVLEIYSMSLNGANLKRLTNNPGYDGFPNVTAASVRPTRKAR